ncbi:membrane protein containing NADH:ubiquinone/plastoquinone oxidoreductase domain protein, partial [mine drainage metagenome]
FHMDPLVYFIAFVSIAWGSVVALSQRDLKRMVAYSSINHMGIVLLAIAVDSSLGLMAAVFLMFAHGVVSGSSSWSREASTTPTGRGTSPVSGASRPLPRSWRR